MINDILQTVRGNLSDAMPFFAFVSLIIIIYLYEHVRKLSGLLSKNTAHLTTILQRLETVEAKLDDRGEERRFYR